MRTTVFMFIFDFQFHFVTLPLSLALEIYPEEININNDNKYNYKSYKSIIIANTVSITNYNGITISRHINIAIIVLLLYHLALHPVTDHTEAPKLQTIITWCFDPILDFSEGVTKTCFEILDLELQTSFTKLKTPTINAHIDRYLCAASSYV